MYYRLKEPYAFRGWKKLPYAVCAMAGSKLFDRPFFFDRETFLDMLYFNGQEDVDSGALSDSLKTAIRELSQNDMLEMSEEKMAPLKSWQRYHVYPARHLENIHWSITGKCNFNCRHCLVSAPTACHPELPFEDCVKIMDEIARCGIHQVDITGGEPLVRRDYERIFEELARRGIYIRVLFTNASLLDDSVLDTLEKHGHRPIFQLSFDGLGHHDWLRGVDGAEKQADEAFRMLKRRKWPCSVAMCIHKGNRDSLKPTVEYLSDLGVLNLRVNAPQYLGVWKEYSLQYALSREEVWDVYRGYIPQYFEAGMPIGLELDGYFSCQKGETEYKIPIAHTLNEGENFDRIYRCESVRHGAHISAEGRLVPCMGFCGTVLEDRFPSILEHPMGELTLNSFYEDVASSRMEDLLAAEPECAKCPHLKSCWGGCMVDGVSPEGGCLLRARSSCYFHKNVGVDAVRAVADAAIEKYVGGTKTNEQD